MVELVVVDGLVVIGGLFVVGEFGRCGRASCGGWAGFDVQTRSAVEVGKIGDTRKTGKTGATIHSVRSRHSVVHGDRSKQGQCQQLEGSSVNE